MNLRARIMACICIISVLISLMLLSDAIKDLEHEVQYTVYSSSVVTNTGIYFTENWNQKGHVYRVNSDGSVKNMFHANEVGLDSILGVCVGEGNVYTMFVDLSVEDEDHLIYRIFKMSPDLKIISASEPFRIDMTEQVKNISWSDDSVFITTMEESGLATDVYNISEDDFSPFSGNFMGVKDEDVDPSKFPEPDPALVRSSTGGTLFVDACYKDGVLSVLTDREKPYGIFKPDSRVQTAIDRIHFTLPQRMSLYHQYISYWLIGLVIWFFGMAVLYVVLQHRNRVIYTYVLIEAVFCIILFSAFFFVGRHYHKVAKEENARYASMVVNYELENLGDLEKVGMEDANYLKSDDYGDLYGRLVDFMESGDNSNYFLDLFIMRKKDGVIMTSYTGRNFYAASHVYGNGLNDLKDALQKNPKRALNDANIEGFKLEAAGSAGNNPTSKYALVGIYVSGTYYAGLWANGKWAFIIFLITFAIGSVLIAIVMYLQNLDLAAFERAIRDVALGRKNLKIPDSPATDMKAMWSSLGELDKKIDEINYDKFRIFEGYYRFAPKNIETIMGKESIFDVINGDVTKVEGTLMLVTTEQVGYGEKRIKSLKNIVSYMSQYSDKEEGILVSQDSTLSILQFLFMKDRNSVASQTTQFIHRNSADEEAAFVSVFLYYDEFLYGVVGVNTQSLIFLTSRHPREMEDYATWFGKMKLPLVMTENVAKREDAGQTRFIGYISLPDEEENISVYEALDACEAKQRQLKLINRDKFEETLNLFYSKDFYLARNNFSELLKDCPDDSMARWYLFECERYLNGEADISGDGCLRVGDQ